MTAANGAGKSGNRQRIEDDLSLRGRGNLVLAKEERRQYSTLRARQAHGPVSTRIKQAGYPRAQRVTIGKQRKPGNRRRAVQVLAKSE
jgi:hypothetical protein